MKNGLIIGGVKIMFTPEQIEDIRAAFIGKKDADKKHLGDVGEGELFKLGNRELIVLEHFADGRTLVLFKDFVREGVKFGENNNYIGSEADEICCEVADDIEQFVGEGNLLETVVDLTADDGLDDYGVITRKAALMTAQMYRKYVRILDKYNPKKWWWLATAYSTPTHDDADWIKCVSPSGNINNNNYNNNSLGVRPYWWIVRQSRHKQPKSVHHTKRTHILSGDPG